MEGMTRSNKRRFQDLTIREVVISYEKSLIYNPECKGVRLDVYANDEKNTRYDIEMQVAKQKLGKRAGYYHSQMDMDALGSGHEYNELPGAYVRKLQETIRSVKENRELESSFMTWEDIRQESKAEGIKESIFLLLEELGQISESMEETILFENRMSILKGMLKEANKAKSIEEFEEQISNL